MGPVHKVALRISLAIWLLWFLYAVVWAFIYPYPYSVKSPPELAMGYSTLVLSFGTRGGGILLSAMLYRRPNRGLAWLLTALCLYILWMRYFGEILMPMLLRGYTFKES